MAATCGLASGVAARPGKPDSIPTNPTWTAPTTCRPARSRRKGWSDRELTPGTDEPRIPPDPALPGRLNEFHQRLPLAGDPANAVLSLPDGRLLSLAALLRDAPIPPPAMTPEEWRVFLDLLVPRGVYVLLVSRLRSWPADCRRPEDGMV